MLGLNNILKVYEVGDERLVALDGINLEFRRSEFVSILGPSGCGKTTLLNIIGGLDRSTEGFLEINGVSSVNFGDREWDSYRNHSIGFVFQNYSLIPHLNVLENVSLALDLDGTDREKSRQLSLAVLEKVGLRNKAYKKPNQLSGGQMQRVAIARALVNDPEIILADEPTGALDSETSVQIMEMLKKISEKRLVIMVTHNAELARAYSTRIIRLYDGRVVGDTNPYHSGKEAAGKETAEAESAEIENNAEAPAKALRYVNGRLLPDRSPLSEEELASAVKACSQSVAGRTFAVLATPVGKLVCPLTAAVKKGVKCRFYEKKALSAREAADVEAAFSPSEVKAVKQKTKYDDLPSMRFGTALRINVTNLINKKFRTLLTAIAGSIGILGISLVLALFSGLNSFIARQEAAFASWPIVISRTSADIASIAGNLLSSFNGGKGGYDENKVYVQKLVGKMLADRANETKLDRATADKIEAIDPSYYYAMNEDYGLSFNIVKEIEQGTRIIKNPSGIIFTTPQPLYMVVNAGSYWTQLPSRELVEEQYKLVAGKYPERRNELVLILDAQNRISDLNLFFNGLFERLGTGIELVYDGESVKELSVTPSDFVGEEFEMIPNDGGFYLEKEGGGWRKCITDSPQTSNVIFDEIIKNVNSEIEKSIGGGAQYKFNVWTPNDQINTYPTPRAMENLVITGVIKLRDDVSAGVLGGNSVGYTRALTEYLTSEDSPYSPQKSNVTKSVEEAYKTANPDAAEADVSAHLAAYGYATVPQSISVYCRDTASKEAFKAELDKISAETGVRISYSDIMSMVFNIVKTFIDIIIWTLFSLTSVALVVSALMIGIVTYVSVLERTGEIGILRALGARKVDISRIFNAENILIGAASGVLGVVLTYILSVPFGALMESKTMIPGLVALPWYFILPLVLFSILLTLAAGLIPAFIAKRKDPVKALRGQ